MEEPCVFRDNEFQIDAFGQGAFYDQGSPGWGGGLDIRFTDRIDLFGDARWLYSNVEPRSGVLARTGLRLAF